MTRLGRTFLLLLASIGLLIGAEASAAEGPLVAAAASTRAALEDEKQQRGRTNQGEEGLDNVDA